MNKEIDCMFIGNNQTSFNDYETMLKNMGVDSGAYKDLNLSFITYRGNNYTAPQIFNKFNKQDDFKNSNMDKFNLCNFFSATIAYLGTFLHRKGLKFDYVNSFQEEKDVLAQKLSKENISVIAIPTTFYLMPFPIIEIINFIKKYNSNAKIVVGGPFIATQARILDNNTLKYILKNIGADIYINSFQGETALADLIKTIKSGGSFDSLDNIFYRKGDEYIQTSVSIEDNKLEDNMVDWNLFRDRVGKYVMIRTAISCPFSCSFCSFPEHAGKYQTACLEAIEQELNVLNTIDSVECVCILDDTFNIPIERFKKILRMFIKNKYRFKWNSFFRCQFVDREMIELMKESGCEGVFLGIESANQGILKNMNKAVDIEKYKIGLNLLNEFNITTYASFIVGFPGETYETVQDTINFIEEYKPTFYRAQLWYCDQYTAIWKEREKYNIKGSQFEWSHFTMNSKEACKIIESMFLNIQNSIWVPQYNFEMYGIYNLLHRGISMNQVQDFVNAFNLGVRQKIINSDHKEISFEVSEKLKLACNATHLLK